MIALIRFFILTSVTQLHCGVASISSCMCCTGKDGKQLSASTRQAALVAVSALGQALGRSRPQPIIAALPAVVAAAQDVHRSVRSSALAAAAACLAALGSQALPLLPKLVPAVIAAAQAAVDSLAGSPALDPQVTFTLKLVLNILRQPVCALALSVARNRNSSLCRTLLARQQCIGPLSDQSGAAWTLCSQQFVVA